jgi:transposase
MPAAVELREDYSADALRQLAARSKNSNQARRLLALAGVRDGMSREAAARIGGMDRQTLRDWVHAFNAQGPDGLVNAKPPGAKPKLSPAQRAEIAGLVEAGPDPVTDGVVRWRCADLRRVIMARYTIDLDEVSIGRLLKEAGFSHISARPRHPAQDTAVIDDFKKTSPPTWRRF